MTSPFLVGLLQSVPGPTFGPRLDPGLWNDLFGWLADVTEPTQVPLVGAVAYGVVGLIALDAIRKSLGGSRGGDRIDDSETPTVSLSGVLGDEDDGPADVGRADVDDVDAEQRSLMAPPAIEWDTRTPRVGSEYAKTLYVDAFPDAPKDGFLSDVFEVTEATFDLTAYVSYRNQNRARERLRERADELTVEAETEDSAAANALQAEAERAAETHRAVEEGSKVFGLSMYVTIRGETREELRSAERKIREALREEPASIVPKTAIAKQDLALQSTAPLGPDVLGATDPDFYEHVALGGAVGALLSSPHDPILIEESGIEFGQHKETRTPVVVDPFERDDGYARFLIGDTGSGKSHDGKMTFVRMLSQREDVIGVVLEPLGNWTGVAEALDAEHVTVGGDKGLNPLEIKPTPDHVLRNMGGDANPYKEKIGDVLAFFDNYFQLRGVTLGDRLPTLELAIDRTYRRAGIDEDITTHHNESPTIRDLIDTVETIHDSPGEFVTRIEAEVESLRSDAEWLLRQLRPFEPDGRYENLGRASEIDLEGKDVAYLDLAQQEGQVSDDAKLVMQLLISLVYQRAKTTREKVVFAIDEFRYVLEDAVNLRFMETMFRHHRHHDLSPWIMTQTVDEFLDRPESEAILDNCAIKQFHSLDGMDEDLAAEFDLNWAQMDFVRNKAQPGSQALGYSDSLLGVDGDWRKVEVRSLPGEFDVIEFDPSDQDRSTLPGVPDDPATWVEQSEASSSSADEDESDADAAASEFTWLDSPQRDRTVGEADGDADD